MSRIEVIPDHYKKLTEEIIKTGRFSLKNAADIYEYLRLNIKYLYGYESGSGYSINEHLLMALRLLLEERGSERVNRKIYGLKQIGEKPLCIAQEKDGSLRCLPLDNTSMGLAFEAGDISGDIMNFTMNVSKTRELSFNKQCVNRSYAFDETYYPGEKIAVKFYRIDEYKEAARFANAPCFDKSRYDATPNKKDFVSKPMDLYGEYSTITVTPTDEEGIFKVIKTNKRGVEEDERLVVAPTLYQAYASYMKKEKYFSSSESIKNNKAMAQKLAKSFIQTNFGNENSPYEVEELASYYLLNGSINPNDKVSIEYNDAFIKKAENDMWSLNESYNGERITTTVCSKTDPSKKLLIIASKAIGSEQYLINTLDFNNGHILSVFPFYIKKGMTLYSVYCNFMADRSYIDIKKGNRRYLKSIFNK